MKVLVTGAAGFIGSHLCRELHSLGYEIVGVDCYLRDSYDARVKRLNASSLQALPNFRMVEADIRSPLPGWVFDETSTIVNLAAMPGLTKSWQDFDLYSSCNLTGVDRLVRQALSRNINHFIQISTSSVYGALARGSETDPLNPVSPYGVTKLAGEKLVAAYGFTHELPFTILRYFSVYGPGQRPDMAYHIICEKLLADEPITVFGDGLQSRSNTHVLDVVQATVSAIRVGPSGEAMNICGGESITLLGAVEVLEQAMDRKARLRFQPPRPGDQLHTHGDASRASALLDFQANVSVEVGLRSQALWHMGASA